MYADDICIIAPSPSALHKLLGMCVNFAQVKVILLNLMRVKPNVCVLNPRNYQVYMSQGSCWTMSLSHLYQATNI